VWGQEPAPERARDLRYGEAVYEFHQQNPLLALTHLEVAAARGGIEGHGRYPLLMKGGMMLSWGMMDSARDIFGLLLRSDEQGAVSPEARQRAWLQLARQLYQSGKRVEARNALEQIEPVLLHQQDPELFYEWHYLCGQIAISEGIGDLDRSLRALENAPRWWGYLRFNQANRALGEGSLSQARELLQDLLAKLPEAQKHPGEIGYLRDSANLLLADLARRDGNPGLAIGHLQQVSSESASRSIARYEMAITAVLAGQTGRANEALTAVQQSPDGQGPEYPVAYARGVIAEQQDKLRQAIALYDKAAGRYERLLQDLQQERAEMTESRLRNHLAFNEPDDFRFVRLSIAPDFRRHKQRLDDLYQLQEHFQAWDRRLDTFDAMLETRQAARSVQVKRVRQALEVTEGGSLQAQYRRLQARIQQAEEEQNGLFFATSEQRAMHRRIESARGLLAAMPEGERRTEQQQRLDRIDAYFRWMIADQFGVNRWAVVKELRELEAELEKLEQKATSLNQMVAEDPEHEQLRQRVVNQRQAVQRLQADIGQAIVRARDSMMTRVDEYYLAQIRQVRDFRVAARHGATRLADRLHQQSNDPESLTVAIDQYRQLLLIAGEPSLIRTASYRLAGLQLQRALEESGAEPTEQAIAAHLGLLEQYPSDAENDQIRYQLARLYLARGEVDKALQHLTALVTEYPDSPLVAESWFRTGDQQFLDGRYREAETAFVRALDVAGDIQPRLALRARYMQGWSQYRQGRYQQALDTYSSVIDTTWNASPEGSEAALVERDTFRAMGLALSQLQRGESLYQLFARIGQRPWDEEAYRRYATMLTEKEQFTEAVAVYDRFNRAYPRSPQAPRFHARAIEVLRAAGFSSALLEREASFVASYGITSDYWAAAATPGTLAFLQERLVILLPRLADHFREQAALAGSPQAQRQARVRAAGYYEEFTRTFPDHPDVAEALFALGEVQLDLGRTEQAIDSFGRVAWLVPGAGPELAAEAGYAAVLAWEARMESGDAGQPSAPGNALIMEQQRNRIRFAQTFPTDPRAPGVYYQALYHEYQADSFQLAADMALQLRQWTPPPPEDVLLDALVVEAHSYYELSDYARAETAYRQALSRLSEGDERRANLRANLAASVYRQGEADIAAGNLASGVDHLLRTGQLVPESPLAASASYQASGYLVELQDWQRAIPLLEDLASGASPAQVHTLTARLALAYRETGQWSRAAARMETLSRLAESPEDQRRNLLEAARLYDRADETGSAIVTWRRYANRYPDPLSAYMQAAHRLAELYQQTGAELKRNFWLERQARRVESDMDVAGDRERRWAAEAAMELARQSLARYQGIRLTLPLNRSMVAKTDALEQAVAAYQRAAGFGVAEVSTEAGYRIADIYARLGEELMNSDKPPGLTELEKAQYDLLLEEQAYPLEDSAINIHEQNITRAREGVYDRWVKRSYEALRTLLPGRYDKTEIAGGLAREMD
jgi:tetratricopeptide (TPR) repeat protein